MSMNPAEYTTMKLAEKRITLLLEPAKKDAADNEAKQMSLRYRLARQLVRLAVRLEPGFLGGEYEPNARL